MRSVGLDLGKKKIVCCEVMEDGRVRQHTVRSLSELEGVLGRDQPPARVAFEACREAWNVHDTLLSWGNVPLLVDTTRVGRIGIGQHGRKTDEIDAEVLARALSEDRLPLAHVLSPARRELREKLGVRHQLVKVRANIVAMLRELLRARGISVPSCAVEAFVTLLQELALEAELRADLLPLVNTLVVVQDQLAVAHERVATLASKEPVVSRLATVRGVSLIVAAAFVSVVDDAGRFRHASQVVSYVGLCPSERSTGGKRRLGAITKQGNGYLRAMLVQAAWCVLRGDPEADPLTQWGRQVAERRGKKVAVVGIARRLVRVLFGIWRRDGAVYDPERHAAASARGKMTEAARAERDAKAIAKATRAIDRGVRAMHRHAEEARKAQTAMN